MKILITAAASLALMTVSASANCVQSDTAGTWRIFVSSRDVDDKKDWQRCTINVIEDGSIQRPSFCIDSAGTKTNIRVRSKLTLRTDCSIKGVIRFGGGVTEQIVDGQLSVDGLSLAGVATDPGGRSTFVGIKR